MHALEVPGVLIRRLEAEDGPEVQELFETDPGYFDSTFGHPPGPAEAQSTFVALPEGARTTTRSYSAASATIDWWSSST